MAEYWTGIDHEAVQGQLHALSLPSENQKIVTICTFYLRTACSIAACATFLNWGRSVLQASRSAGWVGARVWALALPAAFGPMAEMNRAMLRLVLTDTAALRKRT